MQQQQQPMQKQQHAVYDRAVVLIIDALRYDFVCERPGPEKPHAGAFPRTMALVADAVRFGGVVGARRIGQRF
jgi:hypothetical protein